MIDLAHVGRDLTALVRELELPLPELQRRGPYGRRYADASLRGMLFGRARLTASRPATRARSH